MRRLLAPLCLLVALAVPASASATDETVQSGAVRATFSYSCGSDRLDCSGLRLRIFRGGVTALDQPVTVRNEDRLSPGRPGERSVELRQLDPDSEPEVLLDLFTGGANCCLISYIYDFRNGGYARVGRRWGRAGYVLRNLDHRGRIEFDSADPRFDSLYTSTAESRLPIQIFRFEGGRLRAVTRTFKNAVRRDRDEQLRIYRRIRRGGGDVRGALAAYQADNYLLSRRTAARGWRLLRRLADQGKIRRPAGADGPSGRAYLRSLQRKLRRFGYTR